MKANPEDDVNMWPVGFRITRILDLLCMPLNFSGTGWNIITTLSHNFGFWKKQTHKCIQEKIVREVKCNRGNICNLTLFFSFSFFGTNWKFLQLWLHKLTFWILGVATGSHFQRVLWRYYCWCLQLSLWNLIVNNSEFFLNSIMMFLLAAKVTLHS